MSRQYSQVCPRPSRSKHTANKDHQALTALLRPVTFRYLIVCLAMMRVKVITLTKLVRCSLLSHLS
jgi:hypothetical protein